MGVLDERTILADILHILHGFADERGMDVALHADMDILEAGFDSFDFAALIPALEERSGCVIDLTDADLTEIVRISGLASFVARAGNKSR